MREISSAVIAGGGVGAGISTVATGTNGSAVRSRSTYAVPATNTTAAAIRIHGFAVNRCGARVASVRALGTRGAATDPAGIARGTASNDCTIRELAAINPRASATAAAHSGSVATNCSSRADSSGVHSPSNH
jgi:hypothetical protein